MLEKAMRLLIVENSTSSFKLMRDLLSPLDAEIIGAENGIEAKSLFASSSFDCVISDIDMPLLDGVNLCHWIKNESEKQSTPVILVSKFDSESLISRGFEAGATTYISKEDVPGQLLDTVKRTLTDANIHSAQTILLAEDSSSLRAMIGDGLRKQGYEVIEVKNGADALDAANSKSINLILSDINMPVMGGIEFISRFRNSFEAREIPVIIMSETSQIQTMRKAKTLGANAYIVKPFNLESLYIQIDKLLSNQYIDLLKEKSQLESEKHALMNSITSLITALEAKDQYTRGHSENVATLATAMLKTDKASAEDLQVIKRGARLHDIGKIGIPDSVLLKPGKLDSEELKLIQRHPEIGFQILSPIQRMKGELEIVLSHHERFDGKGYPHGLAGTDIPWMARIVAVADTYDAITNQRVYRNLRTPDVAFSIIKQERGKQFCPKCVDLFFSYQQEADLAKRKQHGNN